LVPWKPLDVCQLYPALQEDSVKRILVALSLCTCFVGCGGSKSPTAPSNPTPQTTRVIRLEGDMAFGNIQVGQFFEAVLRVHNSGNGVLTITGMTGPSGFNSTWTNGTIQPGSSQAATIRFSPTEAKGYSGTLTINGDQTSGTNTISVTGTGAQPAGPRQQFGAGQYLVGTEIAAGRYYDDPLDGCYWERQSGLGGTLGEIIANEFIGFNAGQWIVDILPSDKAFKTDSDCGTWFNSPRRGLQANISPGLWLVGSQVNPGVYRATVSSGCYWERTRGFTSKLGDIIANDFVSSAGQQLVEIRSGDVGFQSDADCGTWIPVQASTAPNTFSASSQSPADIEANHEKQRRKKGLRQADF